MLEALVTYFYCMDLMDITGWFTLLSMAFVVLWRAYAFRRWFRVGMFGTLAMWLAVTLWITVLHRTPGIVYPLEWIPFHSLRALFATGQREILRTNFMNTALFYPAGLLAAALLPKRWRYWLTLLIAIFAVFSFGIEYAQYHWVLGRPEMDDVVFNTLGAALGGAMFCFWDKVI